MDASRSRLVHLRRLVVGAAAVLAVAACAPVLPLDDARLVEVGPASPDDLTRYAQARAAYARELFAGASFADGRGEVVTFSADQYDEYRACLRDHPIVEPGQHVAPPPQWPVMRLVFTTDRALFDPEAGAVPNAIFYLCTSGPEQGHLYGFGLGEVTWHGRIVTLKRAREIARLREAGARSQTYELFFDYVYWDVAQTRSEGQQITLLPLPDDLCVAMSRWNLPLPASVGRPLRIARERVNAAAGPVPRPLFDRDDTSN